MKKILFFAALAAVALASCSSDDSAMGGLDSATGDGAISFSAYTGSSVTSRSIVVTKDSIFKSGIGVFAFYQPASNGVAGANFTTIKYPTPDFMYNQKVTTSDNGTSWTYSPTKYWPNNTNDKVTFFAYAPYSATTSWEDLNVTTDGTGNKVSRTFTINNAIKDQVDYLWADPAMNQTKPKTIPTAISFEFNHVTSKVNLYVGVETPDETSGASSENAGKAWNDANTTIEIKSIEFKNLAQTYTWSKEGTNDATFAAAGSQNITATPYTDATAYTKASGFTTGTQYYADNEGNANASFASDSKLYTYASETYTPVGGTTYIAETKYYTIGDLKTSGDASPQEGKTYYSKDSNGSFSVNNSSTNPQADGLYELTATETAVKASDLTSPYYKKGVNYGYVTADTWAAGWHRFLQCKDNNNVKTSSDDPTVGTTKDDQYMFIAPQTFDDQTVTITYTVETKDDSKILGLNESKITNTITKNMSDFGLTDGFAIGKQYNLFFLIGLQTVKVAATINDWTGAPDAGYIDIPAANDFGE